MSPVGPDDFARVARPVPQRPTLLLTFGTIYGVPAVLDPILRELSALDVDLRVTLGPEGSISDFSVEPERVRFEKFAPLAQLLADVDLVVAHGGGGTTLGALASALPLVLAPQGADQFRISERVAAGGAGVQILPGPTAPRDIASAVTTVLADEHFRDNARTVARHIAAMPSPAQIVETIASTVR
jgi:UDP:flavonoid glycosyltransferase YjiC (YdhE family)